MPNWITNKIKAPSHVIAAMLNAEGEVDFSMMSPFPGPCGKDWAGISMIAETAAEAVLNVPFDSHPLIGALEKANRDRVDIKALRDDDFEQFVGMLRNYRACGFLHPMDFNRKSWGTEWNACRQSSNVEAGTAEFETAWACPEPVLSILSKRFPDDVIEVTFADEDIGSNCGTFKLLNGRTFDSDVAGQWSRMSEEERAKWKAFARQVKGWADEDAEKDEPA